MLRNALLPSPPASLAAIAALLLVACGDPASQADLATTATGAEALPAARLGEAPSTFVRRFDEAPVRWQLWDDDTFALARTLNRPVFLYIGYSACPWSQRMRRESLDHPEVVDWLNESFVPVLVDAEQHPDVSDAIMRYAVAARQRSGWPLCAALTPELLPLSAFGYMPSPESRDSATLVATLGHIARQWEQFPDHYAAQAERDHANLQTKLDTTPPPEGWDFPPDLVELTFTDLASRFDPVHGGLSSIPKFSFAPKLGFLLWLIEEPDRASPYRQERARSMLRTILDRMAESAIFDQLGGGFFRYSADSSWNAPNFEKMLADQAQLIEVYARAATALDEPRYADVAARILSYTETTLAAPDGGFYSSEDTGDDGGRAPTGNYYVWSADAIGEALEGTDHDLFVRASEIRERGNIPSTSSYANPPSLGNVPRLTKLASAAESLGLEPDAARASITQSLATLRTIRDGRPSPLVDTKIVLGDNALMVSALARAAETTGDPALRARAESLAEFLLATFYDPSREDSPLMRISLDGAVATPALLGDYANLIACLIALAPPPAPSQDPGTDPWLAAARELQEIQLARFFDPAVGQLIVDSSMPSLPHVSPKLDDSATPSPASVTAGNLFRLSSGAPANAHAKIARTIARRYGSILDTYPGNGSVLVIALAEQGAIPR
ncbi:thioredoxin domain-containing protein [soil metagenome]